MPIHKKLFGKLFKRSETPNPMASWGRYGPAATQEFITGQEQYAGRSRAAQMQGLGLWYGAQKKGLTTGFESSLKRARRGAVRSASSRGLGKSTMALALQPTEDITLRREQALSGLEGSYYQQRAGIREVPRHLFSYMRQKAKHGALEPWELYRQSFKGQRRGGALLGGVIGGFAGGPLGAMVGSQIGGNF